MKADIKDQVGALMAAYDPATPEVTAEGLRDLWLSFEPKEVGGIKRELYEEAEVVGIPIPVLKAIGQEAAKAVRRGSVDEYLPLAQTLWDEHGREGRSVSLFLFGALELKEPERIVPLLREVCRTCVTWEDCDRLAMDALEPIVRKKPDEWLGALEPWLADENKWVRRAAVTVIGRLPMKYPERTEECLALCERLLLDEDSDVRRNTSFAIRLAARGDLPVLRDFLLARVPPADPAATWVLCDVMRSMTPNFLPEFAALLPKYQAWAAQPDLGARERKSIESAIKKLQSAK